MLSHHTLEHIPVTKQKLYIQVNKNIKIILSQFSSKKKKKVSPTNKKKRLHLLTTQ
jgi:hypothetical protein